MVARELLRELEARGVRLAVDGGQLTARAPAGAITPDLAAQIKAQKAELLQELQRAPAGLLAPLPEPLARLIGAAICDHLNRPLLLPAGIVPNLGEYVLACAAQYAAGVEPERQLEALWTARRAWAS
ncbi:hypothetical protein [Deinococcus marmoris]|uniref:TubC N-terminal docking domain-containing protein n=1 Tax=Deinococcus marmoris TaxID=249408 RepID=A0A1U7NX57_9DEIO|nr:hypothetical protein [Deinococcus marmoris]OLV17487.1 hypothetical protein BOO71_0008674 [Deinococcus marmoris]